MVILFQYCNVSPTLKQYMHFKFQLLQHMLVFMVFMVAVVVMVLVVVVMVVVVISHAQVDTYRAKICQLSQKIGESKKASAPLYKPLVDIFRCQW